MEGSEKWYLNKRHGYRGEGFVEVEVDECGITLTLNDSSGPIGRKVSIPLHVKDAREIGDYLYSCAVLLEEGGAPTQTPTTKEEK